MQYSVVVVVLFELNLLKVEVKLHGFTSQFSPISSIPVS